MKVKTLLLTLWKLKGSKENRINSSVPTNYNLDEMYKCLEIHQLSKLCQEEIENLNRLITSRKIESIIKNLPTN